MIPILIYCLSLLVLEVVLKFRLVILVKLLERDIVMICMKEIILIWIKE